MKRSRKFQAGLDALENRTVLSVAQPAAQITALHGSGTLATTTTSTVSNGVNATVELTGTFNGLGQVSGPLTIQVVTGTHKFNASGTLTAANGDTLSIQFVGKDQMTRPHQLKAVGKFPFTVTGGTGGFQGATGRGTITVTQILATGAETFAVNGKVRNELG